MKLRFKKYQGTGNDFVIADNREGKIKLSTDQIKLICDRRFGVGADGLMLLEAESGFDFRMVYFNSDGNESTMCGNGGRCLVRFALDEGIADNNVLFLAIDGPHEAYQTGKDIALKMKDVSGIKKYGNDFWLDTGSPHYIRRVDSLNDYPVFEEGRNIRYSDTFKSGNGTNVNFVREISPLALEVRTYERGVEDETLSCGTGVTAAAIVALNKLSISGNVSIKVPGGELSVKANYLKEGEFNDVWLIGPAQFVFSGEIELPD